MGEDSLFSDEKSVKSAKPKKEHKYLKSLLAILAIILFSAGAAGGVWYWQQSEMKKQRSDSDSKIAALQKQLSEKNTESNEETKTITKDPEYLPIVDFSPAGLFTEQEKQTIREKITDPVLFYDNEEGLETILIAVNKYAENDRRAGYWYNLEKYTKKGLASGWLFGENGNIDYWKPECMGECPVTDAYKAKYPNNLPSAN